MAIDRDVNFMLLHYGFSAYTNPPAVIMVAAGWSVCWTGHMRWWAELVWQKLVYNSGAIFRWQKKAMRVISSSYQLAEVFKFGYFEASWSSPFTSANFLYRSIYSDCCPHILWNSLFHSPTTTTSPREMDDITRIQISDLGKMFCGTFWRTDSGKSMMHL